MSEQPAHYQQIAIVPCKQCNHENKVKLDPYRVLDVYEITHPAQQHAITKLLRAGKSIKTVEQDINEAILALERWKEMNREEKGNQASKA